MLSVSTARAGPYPSAAPARSAVVHELQGDAEVFVLHDLDNLLQRIAALPRHSQLLALDRDLDALDVGRLHRLHDLAGLLIRDALVDLDLELEAPAAGRFHGARLERLPRHGTL